MRLWYESKANFKMIYTRDAPDTDFAGYPADLKAGCWISGGDWIPDIRPEINSTFKCLEKYEINKDLRLKIFFSSP
jgi:hypothetical protein